MDMNRCFRHESLFDYLMIHSTFLLVLILALLDASFNIQFAYILISDILSFLSLVWGGDELKEFFVESGKGSEDNFHLLFVGSWIAIISQYSHQSSFPSRTWWTRHHEDFHFHFSCTR